MWDPPRPGRNSCSPALVGRFFTTESQIHALDEVLNNEKQTIMYQAVEKLKSREKEIIVLRFGLYGNEILTQKEVADKLGISQSYISRLEKKIMDKLKSEIERKLSITAK